MRNEEIKCSHLLIKQIDLKGEVKVYNFTQKEIGRNFMTKGSYRPFISKCELNALICDPENLQIILDVKVILIPLMRILMLCLLSVRLA